MATADISKKIDDIKKKAEKESIVTLLNFGGAENIFAACFKAAKEVLGITAYDEQIEGAAELMNGRIIEMATGEGKTLSAVFAASALAHSGRRVHILTFNDYLASRDYQWMKGIYDMLGISTAYVSQKMSTEEKRAAYSKQVVYVTARECGFDFLRDFVANDESELVHCGFDCAIIDEADSILIDEGRVPLVIAGETAVTPDPDLPQIFDFVKTFDETMYEINEELGTIYLTEEGAVYCEQSLLAGGGLYDEENNALLTKITDCLRACFMLKKDVDYIVKDGTLKIIDEFTGRAAENRRYPGTLQGAVELKEGIESTRRGVIMGVVPIQFFVRQYDFLAGMTGTAKSSEDEFYQLYDLKVSVINTHCPCIRKDHPVELYVTKLAKERAIISRIYFAHEKNQPVLIGTSSIEESERLYEMLLEKGIEASVLNAKNDELEAEIIKNAGAPGAVTISANMSGRGVDIKLGGADCEYAKEVVSAGGLLIIGTFLSESVRGDGQLRGRAGRQGDIGESRFFASLEDEIMTKYDIRSLIPKRHYPTVENFAPITDKVVLREAQRIQRISQGDTLELRRRLLKFTTIGEKHRDIVFGKRSAILTGAEKPEIWQKEYPDGYDEACGRFGAEKTDEMQRRIILSVLNEYWSDYLDYTSYLRDGIHLTRIGGKNPADEYNIVCEEFFSGMEPQIVDTMGEKLAELLTYDDPDEFPINIPSSLWTYILNESGEELLKKSFIETAMSNDELDEYDDETEIEYEPIEYVEVTDDEPKKGLFSKLFGKK